MPIPDSCNICGELIAPPQTITSLSAYAFITSFPFKYSSPTHFVPSNNSLLVIELVAIVKFFLSLIGFKNEKLVLAL